MLLPSGEYQYIAMGGGKVGAKQEKGLSDRQKNLTNWSLGHAHPTSPKNFIKINS